MLESVGLSRQAHDVYRALLLKPDSDLADIAREVGLPVEETRGALDLLTDLSLLHSVESNSHFIPADPEVGIYPLLERRSAELDEQRASLSQGRAAVAALAAEYATLGPRHGGDGIDRLVGVEAVRVRLAELSRQATAEVRSFMPGGALSAAALEACRPLDEQNLARGVRMRTVHLDSVRNDCATVEYADWLASHGGETRTVPSLPMRMILCDRSVAVVPVDVDESHQGAFVIRYQSIICALGELFEYVWNRADSLGAPSAPSSDGPSDRDLALLAMLGDGLTDEGISRKMGVSIRTVRRTMADLMRRLNAQSRFQAGTEAVRRGWV
ncbi:MULTISPECIES: helix-turn-helix domain-containing protein [Streptomyces]|uniref:helix-turn-helix domain-containing protein n=1 Tax=Streptomyces TaxID=1883 RepID=UPI0006E294B8|nr:helix-turn-helix transcriptional regulator [Streptomyces prasinus]